MPNCQDLEAFCKMAGPRASGPGSLVSATFGRGTVTGMENVIAQSRYAQELGGSFVGSGMSGYGDLLGGGTAARYFERKGSRRFH